MPKNGWGLYWGIEFEGKVEGEVEVKIKTMGRYDARGFNNLLSFK